MARKMRSDFERIIRKLVIQPNGCWTWSGYIQKNGYAKTAIGSRRDHTRRDIGIHRFVYEQMVGSVPDGLVLDHLCRNRKCANPSHLEAVTSAENVRRGVFPPSPTHCPKGHSYAEHAYYRPDRPGRECRVCIKANQRRQYQKRKLAA